MERGPRPHQNAHLVHLKKMAERLSQTSTSVDIVGNEAKFTSAEIKAVHPAPPPLLRVRCARYRPSGFGSATRG